MARYFYVADKRSQPDDDGALEFATFEDACAEAEKALREMSTDTREHTLWMSIVDADRRLVHRTRLDITPEVGEAC